MSFWAGAGGQIVGGLLGGLGGLLGGGPSLPPELRNLYRIQARTARSLEQYGRGVPGSDPQELAALASQRALLGEQQRGQQEQLYGAFGTGALPQGNLADFMANLSNQQMGQQSAVTSQHFLNALEARRNALRQAAQTAGAAAGTVRYQEPQGPDMGAIFGQLAQQYAYSQMLRNAAKTAPGVTNFRYGQYGQSAPPGSRPFFPSGG